MGINCSFSVHWFRHSQPGDGWNWDRHQNGEFTPQKPNHRNTMFKRNLEPQFNTPFDAIKWNRMLFSRQNQTFFSKGIAVVPHHLTLMFFSRRIWTWRRFSSLHQWRVGREVGGVRGDPKLCQFDVGKAILFYMGYMGNLPARIVGFTPKKYLTAFLLKAQLFKRWTKTTIWSWNLRV